MINKVNIYRILQTPHQYLRLLNFEKLKSTNWKIDIHKWMQVL